MTMWGATGLVLILMSIVIAMQVEFLKLMEGSLESIEYKTILWGVIFIAGTMLFTSSFSGLSPQLRR